MQILRTDWRGAGKWRRIALGFNAIGSLINDMYGENGIEVEYRGGRLVISGDHQMKAAQFPWQKISFGFRLGRDGQTGAPVVTIYPGTIRLHGLASWMLTADTEVTLAGNPCHVHAAVAVGAADGTAPAIAVMTSMPVSTASTMRFPLYKFELQGDRYVLAQVFNLGDINLAAPLR